ncbi:MAG: substrate-binding domain-containing protein, partial [Pseudoflavonifractor sp.]
PHLSDDADTASKNICFLKYSKHAYLVNGNPGFVTQIIDAADMECRRNHYNLVNAAFRKLGPDVLELLNRPTTKGAILLGTELDSADMERFSAITKPLVVVDNQLSLLPYNAITMNNRDAIFSVVGHMIDLGHPRIGFLCNSIPSNNDLERQHAFEEALVYYGHGFAPELVFPIFPTMAGACDSVTALLQSGTRFPSALVANNDSIAIGAMKAFKDFGLRIPEDISISGFDGLPFSAVSEPPLTTVSVSCSDIGVWAVRLLHDSIRGKSSSKCKMLVNAELTVRSSTTVYHTPADRPGLLGE